MLKTKILTILLGCCLTLTGCTQAAEAPTAPKEPSAEEKITTMVEKLTIEEKVGQMMIVGIPGTGADSTALDMVRKYHVGGIILFDRNLSTPSQVTSLNSALQGENKKTSPAQLFICVDQEGGQVARMRSYLPVAPAAQTLGEEKSPLKAKEWAVKTAQGLKTMGFNVNFAPVADLGFTNRRSYGTSSAKVTPFVTAAMEGYANEGIISSIKHFPGIGRAMVDPHNDSSAIKASKAELQEDFQPFQTIVGTRDNDTFMIMASHLIYPAYDSRPASVSKVLLTDVLRNNWGYKGIIITDDMAMGGLANLYSSKEMGPLAVMAGADILLSCSDNPAMTIDIYNSVVAGVKNGTIPLNRINESVERIYKTKYKMGLLLL